MSKKIQGMSNTPYEARIKALNSIERRRLRGDLTEVFNWYSGYNKESNSKVLMIQRGENRFRDDLREEHS